jgi:hypothetical protein
MLVVLFLDLDTRVPLLDFILEELREDSVLILLSFLGRLYG